MLIVFFNFVIHIQHVFLISFKQIRLSSNFFYAIQVSENKEELKTKLNKLLRDKNDIFNSENPEEDKV